MGFQLFQLMFFLMFFLAFGFIMGTFIFVAVRGLSRWKHNNNSPRLTVAARVISKRTEYGRNAHCHSSSTYHHYYTNYFVTFEVDSGDRIELCLPGEDYGLLIEGDLGSLTFQGTRFLSFERH